jgi:hypothetical protein
MAKVYTGLHMHICPLHYKMLSNQNPSSTSSPLRVIYTYWFGEVRTGRETYYRTKLPESLSMMVVICVSSAISLSSCALFTIQIRTNYAKQC